MSYRIKLKRTSKIFSFNDWLGLARDGFYRRYWSTRFVQFISVPTYVENAFGFFISVVSTNILSMHYDIGWNAVGITPRYGVAVYPGGPPSSAT